MRISKTFNNSDKIPLVIKTLAQDSGSAVALGGEAAESLEAVRAYFDKSKAPPTTLEFPDYREFALPIIDAFLERTDPTFTPAPEGKSPSSEHADWILKIYADRAANDKPIISEDLQKIYTEIAHFLKAKGDIIEQGHPGELDEYETYDAFTNVMRPLLSKDEEYRTLDNAPDDILAATTVLYDGDEGQILVPHTHEASKYFGSVNWCVSYENTDVYFNEDYNPKSPSLMYIPKNPEIGNEADLIASKVAVVDNIIYDARDKVVAKLPVYVRPLRQEALSDSDQGKADYIEMFGDKNPGFKVSDRQEQAQPDEQDWTYLEHLPEEQQDYLKSLKGQRPAAYSEFFIEHPDLGKDRDFVLAAVQQEGMAWYYANPDYGLGYNKDQEIMLKAVQTDGVVLAYVDKNLRKDKDFVFAAVKQNGKALQYADESLQIDKDIVLAAIRQNVSVLTSADAPLFEDIDFAEGLLDIAAQGNKDEKCEVLKHLHRVPAFFGHITADVDALRSRLQDYSMAQKNVAVPDELLYGGDAHDPSEAAPV